MVYPNQLHPNLPEISQNTCAPGCQVFLWRSCNLNIMKNSFLRHLFFQECTYLLQARVVCHPGFFLPVFYDEAVILTSWKIAFFATSVFQECTYRLQTRVVCYPGFLLPVFLWWSCNFNVMKNSFLVTYFVPRMYISSTDPGRLNIRVFFWHTFDGVYEAGKVPHVRGFTEQRLGNQHLVVILRIRLREKEYHESSQK